MSFTATDKTKKFIKQVKSLLDRGEAKNYVEIVEALNWDKTLLSNVINGRKNVPNDVYKRFTEIYQLAPPEQEDLKDEQIQLLKDQNQFLRDQVQELQRRLEFSSVELKEQAKINRAYLKTLYHSMLEHRAALEKIPAKKIQHDMDRLLASFAE